MKRSFLFLGLTLFFVSSVADGSESMVDSAVQKAPGKEEIRKKIVADLIQLIKDTYQVLPETARLLNDVTLGVMHCTITRDGVESLFEKIAKVCEREMDLVMHQAHGFIANTVSLLGIMQFAVRIDDVHKRILEEWPLC